MNMMAEAALQVKQDLMALEFNISDWMVGFGIKHPMELRGMVSNCFAEHYLKEVDKRGTPYYEWLSERPMLWSMIKSKFSAFFKQTYLKHLELLAEITSFERLIRNYEAKKVTLEEIMNELFSRAGEIEEITLDQVAKHIDVYDEYAQRILHGFFNEQKDFFRFVRAVTYLREKVYSVG